MNYTLPEKPEDIPKQRTRLITTTTYRLPNLRYLRPVRLLAVALYAGIFFAVATMTLYESFAYQTDEGGQISVFLSLALLLASFTVAHHLIRLVVALATRHKAHDQTIIAQYETDITPLELSVLLRASTRSYFGRALLQSLADKSAVYVTLTKKGKIKISDQTNITPLTDYEDEFKWQLLGHGHEITLPARKFFRNRAVTKTEQFIYKKLARLGYFEKQTPLEEGLGQYLHTFTYFHPLGIFSYLAMVGLFVAHLASPTSPIYPIYPSNFPLLPIVAILIATLVPLSVYAKSAYTRKANKKFAQACGFYWYLRSIYKHRLATGYIPNKSEQQLYGAYFDAFGWKQKEQTKS